MILSLENIKSITKGALAVREENGWLRFDRFSSEQKSVYEEACEKFFIRTAATASICLDLVTDAESITLDYEMGRLNMIAPDFMFFDVWEDGIMTAHLGRATREKFAECLSIPLSCGEKRVRIYFPNLFDMSIRSIELNGASFFRAVEGSRKALILGDSITQGFDAHHPSLSYANTIIRNFNLDAVNQAIGGEVFRPAMLGSRPLFNPEIITVAYGTNDWASGGVSTSAAREFFRRLTELYPAARIFYISPIWRTNAEQLVEGVSFYETTQTLKSIAKEAGATVIDGDKIMHKLPEMYDDGLHPNDLGFSQYAKVLTEQLIENGVNL